MSRARCSPKLGLHGPVAVVVATLALIAGALVLLVPGAGAEGIGHGARPIDANVSSVAGIQYFTDCDDGSITSDCGGAPGRWFSEAIPVKLCTHQFGRPSSISAEQFRTYVADATEMWNTLDASVGYHYQGDCTSGFRWEDDNGVNEVGFDDSRNVVTGSAAAIARGSWFDIPFFGIPTDRRFVEFDVIVDVGTGVPEVCTRSVIAHELGHVLGFGHSAKRTDLMFNSFDPDDLATCPAGASSDERTVLQGLYGINRAPALQIQTKQVAIPGKAVTLLASATDPEDDPISYEWKQTAGTVVALQAVGAKATFTAPDNKAPLQFTVSARDNYRHRALAIVSVTLDGNTGLPVLQPSFARFDAGTGSLAGGSALGWTNRDDAATYQFCTSVPFTTAPQSCTSQASPTAAMDWDVVLGTIGDANARRVFNSGTRETSMAACNAAGCTVPGVGPLVGGLRWPSWDVDFDYLAMAFDVPGSNIRFTIGGVTNIEGPARRFEIYVGTADDPLQKRIWSCGNVPVNGVCFGLLTPNDKGHLSHVTIVSSRAGTPTTEHQIRVR